MKTKLVTLADGLRDAINSLQQETSTGGSSRTTGGRTGTGGTGMPSTGNPFADMIRQRMMQGGGTGFQPRGTTGGAPTRGGTGGRTFGRPGGGGGSTRGGGRGGR